MFRSSSFPLFPLPFRTIGRKRWEVTIWDALEHNSQGEVCASWTPGAGSWTGTPSGGQMRDCNSPRRGIKRAGDCVWTKESGRVCGANAGGLGIEVLFLNLLPPYISKVLLTPGFHLLGDLSECIPGLQELSWWHHRSFFDSQWEPWCPPTLMFLSYFIYFLCCLSLPSFHGFHSQ